MTPEKIARINELARKKKAEGLTPEEEVEQVIVAPFVTTSKGSKLLTKKETILRLKNFVRYNVKKACMAVALMILNHKKQKNRSLEISKLLSCVKKF